MSKILQVTHLSVKIIILIYDFLHGLNRLTDLSVKLQSLRRLTALYVIKLGAVLGYDEAFINAPLSSSVSVIIILIKIELKSIVETEFISTVVESRKHYDEFYCSPLSFNFECFLNIYLK